MLLSSICYSNIEEIFKNTVQPIDDHFVQMVKLKTENSGINVDSFSFALSGQLLFQICSVMLKFVVLCLIYANKMSKHWYLVFRVGNNWLLNFFIYKVDTFSL